MRVFITDRDGKPLDVASAFSRRKALTTNWYNHQWLTRQLAVMHYLRGAGETIQIGSGDSLIELMATHFTRQSLEHQRQGLGPSARELPRFGTASMTASKKSPTMSDVRPESLAILPEPTLQFRYGQRLVDPHSGLSLFGPYDADSASHPTGIAYGVIGAPEGIDSFEQWSERIKSPILTAGHEDDEVLDRKQHVLWPSYPGFEAAFAATWHGKAAWKHPLDREAVLYAARDKDANHRAMRSSACTTTRCESRSRATSR